MQLFCRYGTDPSAPEEGFVLARHDQDVSPDLYPGCVMIRYEGSLDDLGRFGPEPGPLGEAPTRMAPSHAELDLAGIPRTVSHPATGEPREHPLRAMVGQTYPDKRAVEDDTRPYRAPRFELATRRALRLEELSAACGTSLAGGFSSAALGTPHVYPSDEEGQRNINLKAAAALRGQQTPGWTAALKCRDATGSSAWRPHTPAQLHQVLGDFSAFHDAAATKIDTLRTRVASAATAEAIAAVTWA